MRFAVVCSKVVSEIEPVYVTSTGEFVEAVTDMLTSDSVLWYRGHGECGWDVMPSIHRGYTSADERNLANRFRSRAAIRYSPAPGYDASAGWLSLMQHYGLPTRMLDWTRSPLIAVYFALEKYLQEAAAADCDDAVIWVLQPYRLNAQEGFIPPVTPSIDAHMCEGMLAPAFTEAIQENGKILAAMASETDLRMFVQQGCFTIHSSRTALNKRQGHSEFLRPVVISGNYVPRMAREIAACGFRQGDIYPDLGHLAEELKRAHPPGWSAT